MKKVRLVELFPKIINREVFINRDHPTIHPEKQEFVDYWRREKKRCIEGFWGKETEGHWRWMNPLLYFYINHYEILIVDEENKARYHSPPNLDDVEWIITSYLTACEGFSGFTKDDTYTCHNLVKKFQDAEAGIVDKYGKKIYLTVAEERRLKDLKYVYKPDVTLKEYIEPFEYLKLSHSMNMGYALYENDPMNGMIFTARSNGKSFIISADGTRLFSLGGAKYFDNPDFPPKTTSSGMPIKFPGEIMIGAPDPKKTLELVQKIEHGLFCFKGGYDDGDVIYPPPFSKSTQGSYTVNSTVRAVKDVKKKGKWSKEKEGSFIDIVNYGTDLNAGASKRLIRQIVDEVGLLEGADEMHGVSKFSKSGGGVKYGNTIYVGTGGDIQKIDSSKRLFYGTDTYEIYSIPDYWENKGRIGLFMPGYYSLRRWKDENGNTLFEEAISEITAERERLALSPDPLPLIQEKMFMPLVPSEMFYTIQDNIFNTAHALDRINELEDNLYWESQVSVGRLNYLNKESKEVRWEEVPSYRNKVINDLLLDKYNDKSGAIAIYEHPDDAELEMQKLFKVVYDPYKIDGKGESYASVLVYKGIPSAGVDRLRDTIVAEYLGRPHSIDDAHEVAIRLAMYYNTKVLFEDNIPGFKKYCVDNKVFHLLQEEPWDAVNDGYTGKRRTRTYKVGITMSGQLKTHALQLLRKWLSEPRDRNDDGVVIRTNTHELYSKRLLNELINFGEGNFDHISGMLLLMLWVDQDGKLTSEEKVSKNVDEFDMFFKHSRNRFYNPYLDI
jgi:hypothetical protein